MPPKCQFIRRKVAANVTKVLKTPSARVQHSTTAPAEDE